MVYNHTGERCRWLLCRLYKLSMQKCCACCVQLGSSEPATDASPGLALELVLPGVTVPWAHALYIWAATALSLAVHEVRCRGLLACMPPSYVLRQIRIPITIICVSTPKQLALQLSSPLR